MSTRRDGFFQDGGTVRAAVKFESGPLESKTGRNVERRLKRVTPMTPSQAKRIPIQRPSRTAGDCYTNDSYRRAIHRVCDAAFPPQEPLARREGETASEMASAFDGQSAE